jgi:hypothetical protein
MSLRNSRELAEIAMAMQLKALAFDCVYPATPLGTWSAEAYTDAIIALVPETDRAVLGQLMLEASKRAMLRLLPKCERGYVM